MRQYQATVSMQLHEDTKYGAETVRLLSAQRRLTFCEKCPDFPAIVNLIGSPGASHIEPSQANVKTPRSTARRDQSVWLYSEYQMWHAQAFVAKVFSSISPTFGASPALKMITTSPGRTSFCKSAAVISRLPLCRVSG